MSPPPLHPEGASSANPGSLLVLQTLREPRVHACLGRGKEGANAVVFFPLANLHHAIEILGERRYRDLLIDARDIGQRIYRAAEAAWRNAHRWLRQMCPELQRAERPEDP